MNANSKNLWLLNGAAQKSPIQVSLAAYSLAFLVFLGDWATPALVAIGLAYEAPVIYAGLKGTRSLVIQVIGLGVVGLVLGWVMDLAADSFHFSADRIENRLLSLLSLVLVGWLTLQVQTMKNGSSEKNA